MKMFNFELKRLTFLFLGFFLSFQLAYSKTRDAVLYNRNSTSWRKNVFTTFLI